MPSNAKIEHPYLLVISLCFLTLSLFFGGLFLYIIPNVLWDLDYNVPYVLDALRYSLMDSYGYSDLSSRIVTLIIFFIPALVFGYLNYRMSNYLELLGLQRSFDIELEEKQNENTGEPMEGFGWFVKIFAFSILLVALLFALQWLLSSPTAEFPV